jgi:hypothetical protein
VAIALHLTTGNGFPAHLLVYIAAVTVVAVHDRTARSHPAPIDASPVPGRQPQPRRLPTFIGRGTHRVRPAPPVLPRRANPPDRCPHGYLP